MLASVDRSEPVSFLDVVPLEVDSVVPAELPATAALFAIDYALSSVFLEIASARIAAFSSSVNSRET